MILLLRTLINLNIKHEFHGAPQDSQGFNRQEFTKVKINFPRDALLQGRVTSLLRALTFHQYGPGSNPCFKAIYGLSLLLVLSLATRDFSPCIPIFPSPQNPTLPNSNSIWNTQTCLNKFIRTPNCFVGKQITKRLQLLSGSFDNHFLTFISAKPQSCDS